MTLTTPRHPAGTRQGGRFAPGPSPDAVGPRVSLSETAAEIDALAAKAAVRIGVWEECPDLPRRFESKGCSTTTGPLRGVGEVTLQSVLWDGSWWTATAVLSDLGGVFVTHPRPAAGALKDGLLTAGACWPTPRQAMAALESVLAGGAEASWLSVRRHRGGPQAFDRPLAFENWDWETSIWEPEGRL